MKGPGINPEIIKGEGTITTMKWAQKTQVVAASKFFVEQGRAVARSTLHKVKKAYLSTLKMRKTSTKSKVCCMPQGGDLYFDMAMT